MKQQLQSTTLGNYLIRLEGDTLKISLLDNISTLAIIPSSGNSILVTSLTPQTIKNKKQHE